MGFRDQFYPQTIANLILKNGESAPDDIGNRLPVMPALHSIGILGVLSQHVIRVISEFQDRVGAPPGAVDIQYLNADGVLRDLDIMDSAKAAVSKMTVADYVAGVPKPGVPFLRSRPSGGAYCMPYIGRSLSEETAYLSFIRQMMYEWQGAVDASAGAIRADVNTSNPMAPEYNASFWKAVRQLCSSIDVLDTNPPQDFFDKVKGAVNAAIDKTATWAGEAAAAISEKTGEIIGNFAGGFFSNAGLVSIAVAGVAVYLFIA